jgi:hypothetical protein
MRIFLKKFKSMVKKHGFLGVLLLLGGLSVNCGTEACKPKALYGPQGCTTDAECQSRNGAANWYCDTTNAYDDGCGNVVTWPICKTKNVPAPDYGPQPV